MSDCCSNKKSSHGHDHSDSKKNDWKSLVMWVAIGILAVVVLFTVFSGGSSANSLPSSQVAGQVATSYGGMVGGC